MTMKIPFGLSENAMIKIMITLALMAWASGCSSDHDDNMLKTSRITIHTIQDVDAALFAKTVILYEDDHYRISTYFDQYISSYPFDVLFGYDELMLQASHDALTQDTLVMQDYVRSRDDGTFTLAYHLEKGTCLVYDKKLETIIKTVQMEKFTEGGPMTTTARRRFFIHETLFLETVDLVS